MFRRLPTLLQNGAKAGKFKIEDMKLMSGLNQLILSQWLSIKVNRNSKYKELQSISQHAKVAGLNVFKDRFSFFKIKEIYLF